MSKISLIIQEYDLQLINFDNIFQNIEIKSINEINKLKLIEKNNYKYIIDIRNKNIKRIIKHHIIHTICQEISSIKSKYRPVIFIQPEIISRNNEIFNYCNYDLFRELLIHTLQKINANLPIVIYFSHIFIDFDCYPDCKGMISSGKLKELFSKIVLQYKNNRVKSFEIIKKYAKSNGLTFLSKDYFELLKTKLLLIK